MDSDSEIILEHFVNIAYLTEILADNKLGNNLCDDAAKERY